MQIESLENTYSYLCQGGESLSILINFYKTYKKLQEEMALKLSDISVDLECSEMVNPYQQLSDLCKFHQANK